MLAGRQSRHDHTAGRGGGAPTIRRPPSGGRFVASGRSARVGRAEWNPEQRNGRTPRALTTRWTEYLASPLSRAH